MSFQPGAVVYTQSFGSRPENVEVPHIEGRNPAPTDFNYPVGKKWVNDIANTTFELTSLSSLGGILVANWVAAAGGSSGITSVVGTANQVNVSTVAGVATISLSSTLVAPGTVTVAGQTTLGPTDIVGAVNINTSGSADTHIGFGGTGQTIIGNSTGDSIVSGDLLVTGNYSSNGNITLNNGNITLSSAGDKLNIATGTNASIGTSAAMTAGTITIATTAVTVGSQIFVSHNTPGGTPGILSVPEASIVAGTSFVINSTSSSDTSTVNWLIIN